MIPQAYDLRASRITSSSLGELNKTAQILNGLTCHAEDYGVDMSRRSAQQLASNAYGQAIAAVNLVQRSPVHGPDQKYQEYLTQAVANLSGSFLEFLKEDTPIK